MTPKFNKSTLRAIAAAERLGFKRPEQPEKRQNPFTGRSHVLAPEACLLYDFVTTKTATMGRDYTRQEWDWARYGFCGCWPTEYFDLLD